MNTVFILIQDLHPYPLIHADKGVYITDIPLADLRYMNQSIMAAVQRDKGAVRLDSRHGPLHDVTDRIAHVLTSVFIIQHLNVLFGIIKRVNRRMMVEVMIL